jgi:hypothetical protein
LKQKTFFKRKKIFYSIDIYQDIIVVSGPIFRLESLVAVAVEKQEGQPLPGWGTGRGSLDWPWQRPKSFSKLLLTCPAAP